MKSLPTLVRIAVDNPLMLSRKERTCIFLYAGTICGDQAIVDM